MSILLLEGAHIIGPDAANERQSLLIAKTESCSIRSSEPVLERQGQTEQLYGLLLDQPNVAVIEVEVVIDAPQLGRGDVIVENEREEQNIPGYTLDLLVLPK